MPKKSGGQSNFALPHGSPIRVLVVEDNEDDYLVVRRFLTRHQAPGHVITWVSTVSEALALLAVAVFDVCLIDLHLPDGHGLQVVQWLTDERPEVATVVMTIDDGPDADEPTLIAGADFFLSKSDWNEVALTRAVRYALQSRRRFQSARFGRSTPGASRELLPICMDCKKIRDDHDYWHALESYLQAHAGLEFTHGFCPACYKDRLEEVRRLVADEVEPLS